WSVTWPARRTSGCAASTRQVSVNGAADWASAGPARAARVNARASSFFTCPPPTFDASFHRDLASDKIQKRSDRWCQRVGPALDPSTAFVLGLYGDQQPRQDAARGTGRCS